MGILKSRTDIQYFREANRIASEICETLIRECVSGVSTVDLERRAVDLLALNRATAPFRNFDGFGHATCISINEEVVNGPPSRLRVLKDGDVVSVALGVEFRGLHGKVARTTYVGVTPSADIQRLLSGTRAVFEQAVAVSRQAKALREILQVVPEVAGQHQLVVVKDTGGSGIGKRLHDAPATPNDPEALDEEIPLVPGLAFTLMPMLTLGETEEWELHEDGWTYVTKDGAVSAHIAETLMMTENGLEVMTRHRMGSED